MSMNWEATPVESSDWNMQLKTRWGVSRLLKRLVSEIGVKKLESWDQISLLCLHLCFSSFTWALSGGTLGPELSLAGWFFACKMPIWPSSQKAQKVSHHFLLLLAVNLVVEFGSQLGSCQMFVEGLVHLLALLRCEMVLPVSNLTFRETKIWNIWICPDHTWLVWRRLTVSRCYKFLIFFSLSGHLSWRRHLPICHGSWGSSPSWPWRCLRLRSAAPEPPSGWSRRSRRPYGCSRAGPLGKRGRTITARYNGPVRFLTIWVRCSFTCFNSSYVTTMTLGSSIFFSQAKAWLKYDPQATTHTMTTESRSEHQEKISFSLNPRKLKTVVLTNKNQKPF